jgi:hypothetical protein
MRLTRTVACTAAFVLTVLPAAAQSPGSNPPNSATAEACKSTNLPTKCPPPVELRPNITPASNSAQSPPTPEQPQSQSPSQNSERPGLGKIQWPEMHLPDIHWPDLHGPRKQEASQPQAVCNAYESEHQCNAEWNRDTSNCQCIGLR